MFISVLLPNYIFTLWRFQQGRTAVIQQVAMFRPVKSMVVHDDTILCGFEHGDTCMMLWGKNPLSKKRSREEELLFLTTHSSDCHQVGLSSLDYHPHLEIYCSGGLDRMVRVFNLKKELIKEVKFPQPVSCVSFMNKRGDILVGHDRNVSVVMNADLYLRHVVDVSYPVPESELDYFYQFTKPVKDKQFWSWKKLEDQMVEGEHYVEKP
jgi:WD40 repeat protein